jgi:hypothetical protein
VGACAPDSELEDMVELLQNNNCVRVTQWC